MGRFALRNEPFYSAKWAVLQCEMGRFGMRFLPNVQCVDIQYITCKTYSDPQRHCRGVRYARHAVG